MKPQVRQDRAWLLATAKAVAADLKPHMEGTCLRIRLPSRATTTNTDGWAVCIGDLGTDQPRLEVWFDRFSGYSDRKLYACFRAERRQQIGSITKLVDRKLWRLRVVTTDDTEEGKFLVLGKRLPSAEFNTPILEKYTEGHTFYGIYDRTRESVERVSPHFRSRAVAFFVDVARALPKAKTKDEQDEAYPRFENRKLVAAHLRRERSRLLATERKIQDDYTCQVCRLRFEDVYGRLGFEFAEAHHRVPLSKLREEVRTTVDDLVTVCANCHRMLHRMEGCVDDIKKLKRLINDHRK